jgi:thiamine-phosphate pyrophosphorylase
MQNINCIKEDLKLYAITDRSWLNGRELIEDVKLAIEGGITFLQVREKDLDRELFINEINKIKEICNKNNIKIIINDNVELAKRCDADGVHIGQNDMDIESARKILGSDKIIGVSAKTVKQAIDAQKKGADYLGVGAVFNTNTKKDASGVSIEELKNICQNVNIPVCAIGGISEKNILKLSKTGISGVAVISAIFGKKDIKKACIDLKKKVEEII